MSGKQNRQHKYRDQRWIHGNTGREFTLKQQQKTPLHATAHAIYAKGLLPHTGKQMLLQGIRIQSLECIVILVLLQQFRRSD